MLAHAWALLRSGHEVHLVGGTGTPVPVMLQREARLRIHAIDGGAADRGTGMAAVVATGTRGTRLGWRLARTLLKEIPAPDLVLIQTPPALPTLPVAVAAARLRGCRLIVDWHNLSWTLLALRFGSTHALVRAARGAEIFFGRQATAHVTVSARMAGRLEELGFGHVAVLHDGPSAVRPFPPAPDNPPGDPLVVVAPMGWTRDDDLALLAHALRLLGERMDTDAGHQRGLHLLVSGNGPLRPEWGPRLRALGTGGLRVDTPDVAPEEYPHLLASGHIGLSLHRSSSGLDLPMKILELRAVGVPVLTLNDGSPLDEIAPPGCGVLQYETAQDLARHLYTAVSEEAGTTGFVARLTAQARNHPPPPWDDRWAVVMAPLLPAAE
jgi:beta-1,4-mannosyltransferase